MDGVEQTFDLLRRYFLGFEYAPVVRPSASSHGGRVVFTLGGSSTHLNPGKKSNHMVDFLKAKVYLNPFSADILAVDYDYMKKSDKPFFRISTFWGGPRRHDIYLNLGVGFGLGRLLVLERDPKYDVDVEIGRARINWDDFGATDFFSAAGSPEP